MPRFAALQSNLKQDLRLQIEGRTELPIMNDLQTEMLHNKHISLLIQNEAQQISLTTKALVGIA